MGASGGLAGAGSLTIVYPLDYARTRLASDVGSGTPQFTGLVDCLMKTAASGGFLNMYNGFGVSVVGIVAYRGPYFGVFDTLKEKNPFKKDKGVVGLLSKFAIAQTTAIIAGFISYPFDTVRRRLQMQSEKPKEQWLYKGTPDCAVKIVGDEGIAAMFKGFGANVLRTLGGALVLVGYDEIKRILGGGHTQDRRAVFAASRATWRLLVQQRGAQSHILEVLVPVRFHEGAQRHSSTPFGTHSV